MAQHPDFFISKEINAPLEKVWQAWTQEESLKQWWGPIGYDLAAKTFDLQPEGVFHYHMSANGGPKMWGRFVYKQVAPPRRLEFLNSFSDEEGTVLRAPFSDTWPLEMYNVLTLEEKDGKTKLTLAGKPYNATPEEEETYASRHEAMHQAFTGTFAKLEEFLN